MLPVCAQVAGWTKNLLWCLLLWACGVYLCLGGMVS